MVGNDGYIPMPANLAATLIMGRSGEPLLAIRRGDSWQGGSSGREVLLEGWMSPLAIMASLFSIMEPRAQESLLSCYYHTSSLPFSNILNSGDTCHIQRLDLH